MSNAIIPDRFDRFDLYLKLRIHKLFIELIEITYRVWAIVFTFAFLNTVRIHVFHSSRRTGGIPEYVILFGFLTLLVSIVVAIWLSISYGVYVNKVAKRSGNTKKTYYFLI